MSLEILKIMSINILVFVLAGVLAFVPLTNWLNVYFTKKQKKISYLTGIFWGIGVGIMFSFFTYFKMSMMLIYSICGSVILITYLYHYIKQKRK